MSKSSSHADEPTMVSDTDLSRAWASVFLRSPRRARHGGLAAGPKPQRFRSGGPSVRRRRPCATPLISCSAQKRKISVEDVAYTIFPERLWQIAGRDRARLFELYKGVHPRYVAMNRRANGRGLYFERLTMFGDNVPCDGNQLEWILSQYNSRSGRARFDVPSGGVRSRTRSHHKRAARLSRVFSMSASCRLVTVSS